MKILIAPDSFKHALSALDVARRLRKGLLEALPDAEIQMVPMADGGEGTVESLIDATGGSLVTARVHDPLMREIEAGFGISGDGTMAVIEMAAASGLQLIGPREKNPWITSTWGTGELIREALDRGCRTLLMGIGGSATNDCGSGMAMALGVRFLDEGDRPVGQGGGVLGKIRRIDVSGLDPRINDIRVIVACDVRNPLTGPDGASLVYGPQKGAGKEMALDLDRNLAAFAALIRDQLGKEVDSLPGSGAAGGLGAGLIAFLEARLVEGVPAIAERIGLEEKIRWADLVITGEGSMDFQTRFGKTPSGVAKMAKCHDKPVIAVTGSLGQGYRSLYEEGFDVLVPIPDAPVSLEEAIARTPEMLERSGRMIGNLLKLGG